MEVMLLPGHWLVSSYHQMEFGTLKCGSYALSAYLYAGKFADARPIEMMGLLPLGFSMIVETV